VLATSLGTYSIYAYAAGHSGSRPAIALSATAEGVTMTPGSSTRIALLIRRRRLAGPVRLKLVSKPVRGLTVRLTPARTRGSRAALSLRTSARVRLRRYKLRVRASAGRLNRTIVLIVNVVRAVGGKAPSAGGGPPSPSGGGTGGTGGVGGSPFTITGNAAQALQPGLPQPIELQIHNPNGEALSIAGLSASVSAVNAPNATPGLPCSADEFAVQQYSGPLPLVVAPGATVSLGELGVPRSQWPQVSLLNLPTNQDGCQGASVTLRYTADARVG
jgi:hypothetical protein